MKETFGIRITTFTSITEDQGYDPGVIGIFNDSGLLSSTDFSFEQHGSLLHKWCNKPYSARFWNMAGSYEDFVDYYKQRQATEGVQLRIFSINDKPIAFTELYPIIGSELEAHIPSATDKDFGIHFLMAPPRKIAEEFRQYKRSISFFTLREALRHSFKTGKVGSIYAEPDKDNHKACHLANAIGFDYVRNIQLSDKTACLFCYSKEDFNR